MNDCRQPNVEEAFKVSDLINKISKETKDRVVSIEHELKTEEVGWFYLFPCGISGLKETSRQVKISSLDYFQFRILGRDTRFQRNNLVLCIHFRSVERRLKAEIEWLVMYICIKKI